MRVGTDRPDEAARLRALALEVTVFSFELLDLAIEVLGLSVLYLELYFHGVVSFLQFFTLFSRRVDCLMGFLCLFIVASLEVDFFALDLRPLAHHQVSLQFLPTFVLFNCGFEEHNLLAESKYSVLAFFMIR